jgi:undecaprenyl diphosphate synthase
MDMLGWKSDPPMHVAIIMDGNGRWARSLGRPRTAGHRRGAERVREVVTRSRELGIRYLTLFAFSSENWGRPAAEVSALMGLLSHYLASEPARLRANAIELAAVGNLDRLPPGLQDRLSRAIAVTRGLGGMRLTLALSYGARDEITRAMRRLVAEEGRAILEAGTITEESIARRLDTTGTPDPDLVVRTGGEQRLSNLLLWQAAYAELYFTAVPWPEFGSSELERALAWYRGRQRRFGLVSEIAAGQ